MKGLCEKNSFSIEINKLAIYTRTEADKVDVDVYLFDKFLMKKNNKDLL